MATKECLPDYTILSAALYAVLNGYYRKTCGWNRNKETERFKCNWYWLYFYFRIRHNSLITADIRVLKNYVTVKNVMLCYCYVKNVMLLLKKVMILLC